MHIKTGWLVLNTNCFGIYAISILALQYLAVMQVTKLLLTVQLDGDASQGNHGPLDVGKQQHLFLQFIWYRLRVSIEVLQLLVMSVWFGEWSHKFCGILLLLCQIKEWWYHLKTCLIELCKVLYVLSHKIIILYCKEHFWLNGQM